MDQHPPTSFALLLARLPRLRLVRFTGDPAPARELDQRSGRKRSLWARKAWRALQALDAYAHAKEAGQAGGFREYCLRTPIISAQQVAPQESPTALSKWGGQRLFRVPRDVDPSGRVLMVAHIRLDSRGAAPRIYYLDRTGLGRGVIVGYIGPHLTNTRTS